MDSPLAIIGFAAFVWWFSTGLVLYLNRRAPSTFSWSLLGGTVLFLLAFIGIGWSKDQTTTSAAFCAFSCGLVAWAWQELTFYLGYVTGPRRHSCAPGCSGWRHFGHAIGISLYHEISIILTAGLLTLLLWDAPNKLALWTFLLVWLMHQSARLNVFLGVRNVAAEWVPDHLPFLRGFLRQRAFNPFFPVSQVIGGGLLIVLTDAAVMAPEGSFKAVSLTFLATFAALALLEHWFLVLPLPLTGLWAWWAKKSNGSERQMSHHDQHQSCTGDMSRSIDPTGHCAPTLVHDIRHGPLGGC